ncbi:unnamed protein product [Arabidopsis lyrata]|nr:unnamed protein product [Arabidopsis lyrata]
MCSPARVKFEFRFPALDLRSLGLRPSRDLTDLGQDPSCADSGCLSRRRNSFFA